MLPPAFSFSFRVPLLALLLGAGLAAPCAGASDLDTIGLTTLRTRDATLTGSGVNVAQVEASTSSTSEIYQPSPALAGQPAAKFTYYDTTYPWSAGGATYDLAKQSSHANAVADHFFDTTTGVSPGVSSIKAFYVNQFLDGILSPGIDISCSVINQSFVWPAEYSNVDQAYDNYAATYKTLFVNGVNNGVTKPPSPATMYNGIAVGLPTGFASSVGPTANGRCKPDIVAPSDLTSYATPYVAGAAAVLIQAGNRGDGGSGTATAATNPRTLKALLMNGAVKPPGWTRVGAEPLDRKLGAGILNINNSHLQLSGGMQAPTTARFQTTAGSSHLPPIGVSANVSSLIGWNSQSLVNNGTTGSGNPVFTDATDHYFFDLPATQSGAFDATVTLAWNRQSGKSTINNLDVFLYRVSDNSLVTSSTSSVDNIEHIYLKNLPAGRYDLQVYKPATGLLTASESYALAFQFSPVPPPSAPTNFATAPATDTSIALNWSDTASDETGFRILRSLLTGSGFTEIATLPANSTKFTDTGLDPGKTYFYQLTAYSLAGSSTPATTGSATTFTTLENWRKTYFNAITDTGDAANSADPDHDGIQNLIEYALGSNPTIGSGNDGPMALPSAAIATDNGTDYLTLSVKRKSIPPGITYAVQASGDLSSWNDPVTTLTDTATEFKVRDNTPASSSDHRFLRLKITSP